MDSFNSQDKSGYNITPHINNPPPQIFGGSDSNGSPSSQNFSGGPYFTDDQAGGLDESNDAKRRRIARVWDPPTCVEMTQSGVDYRLAGL